MFKKHQLDKRSAKLENNTLAYFHILNLPVAIWLRSIIIKPKFMRKKQTPYFFRLVLPFYSLIVASEYSILSHKKFTTFFAAFVYCPVM